MFRSLKTKSQLLEQKWTAFLAALDQVHPVVGSRSADIVLQHDRATQLRSNQGRDDITLGEFGDDVAGDSTGAEREDHHANGQLRGR